jgi:hypothetical protein
MTDQSLSRLMAARRTVIDTLHFLDRSRRSRFLAVALAITPLVFLTRWIAGIHGTFMYDDLDILSVVRTMPLAQSLWQVHGDVPIPLFRIFFAGMYALFGVNELYWNLYFLLLVLAVNLTALAIIVALGANLVVSILFFLTTMSAAVWNYNPTVGYYSMSIYPQIGLLGLLGVLAIIHWRSSGTVFYKWLALAVSIMAPFIHPSGAYVPMAVGAFTYFNELARAGGSWSPLRMLAPDFRWLTIGLTTGLVSFAAYFAAVVHDAPFLSMAHSPLSAIAVIKSAWFLFSQGVAYELLRPLIRLFLRHTDMATQDMAAVTVALTFSIAGFLNVTTAQRRTYLALLAPSIIIIIVVSLGRRLTGIDDVVNSVGKYNTYAYLWFSIANFYLLSCLATKIPVRWREPSAVLAVLIVATLFVQYTRQYNAFRVEAISRGQQMESLLAVFRNYAARTAPAPMHIPTLDGNFISPAHAPLLYRYNLAHYRAFFQDFDDRLTLLRTAVMDNWGKEGTQTVRSLREATDPAFIRALETDSGLQSLYLDSVELEPRKTRPDGQPMRLDELAIKNADIVRSTANSVSFTTAGGASAMLLPGDWDPEQIHILSMNVSAVLDTPIPGEEPQVEVLFEGQLPIPYRPNRIAVPAGGSVISVDLLQLYSYSLNPRVGKLSLRFPGAGSYTITDLRLAQ